MTVYHFPVSSLENKTALSSSTRAKTCSSLKKRAVITGRHTDSGFVFPRNEKNFALQFDVFQGQSRGWWCGEGSGWWRRELEATSWRYFPKRHTKGIFPQASSLSRSFLKRCLPSKGRINWVTVVLKFRFALESSISHLYSNTKPPSGQRVLSTELL